ncbi:UNVERIFIED_ORG: hypothetical protein EDC93_105222 [Bacillus cereus]
MTTSLSDIADQISFNISGKKITDNLEEDWLRNALNKINKTKAKRIFNAMLLPPKGTTFGGNFTPLIYSQNSPDYNIDHLIPESKLVDNVPGINEGQTLRNFAPLPTNNNKFAKATDCSIKIGPKNVYHLYLKNITTHLVKHPYCQWLVETHFPSLKKLGKESKLNDQGFLESNQKPAIGDDRINYTTQQLLQRI